MCVPQNGGPGGSASSMPPAVPPDVINQINPQAAAKALGAVIQPRKAKS
jgi:hypothetical protein